MTVLIAAWEFLKRLSPAQMFGAAMALALLVQTARIEGIRIWPLHIVGLKDQLTHAKDNLKSERDLRAAERKSYTDAQHTAQINNEKQLQRVQHEQEQISSRVKSDYARDLERLRNLAKAPQSPAKPTGTPGVSKPAPGTHADGLPVPAEPDLRAAEIELRLMHLQNWVLQQVGVNPNAP